MIKLRQNEHVSIAEAARIRDVSQSTVGVGAKAGKKRVCRKLANRYRLFLWRGLQQFLAQVARPAKRRPHERGRRS